MEAWHYLRDKAHQNPVTGQWPVRSYLCGKCGKFHITSKPMKKGNGNGRR